MTNEHSFNTLYVYPFRWYDSLKCIF
jgi:hypothetical protein